MKTGKEPRRVDLGRALKKAKEPPQFGVADRLRTETRGKPKGGYNTYSYDATCIDRSGNSHSYRVRNAEYVIIRAKEYYTDFGGNTRYVSGGVYRRPVQDYPNLRSSRGSYAYIGKYVEVDYVGENPWKKTAGYYSSWKNAGNGAAGKQLGNSFAGKEDGFASASGRSAKVDQIVEVMKKGKVSTDRRRIITEFDDRTKIIFGLDVGNNAHELKLKGYPNPVDHMNIEIQITSSGGNVRTVWDMHLILNNSKEVINRVLTGTWTKGGKK